MVKVGDKVLIVGEGMATVIRLIGKRSQKAVVTFDEDDPGGFPVERFIEEEEKA